MRTAAFSFIEENSAGPEMDAELRSEIDCLLSLWMSGRINPVMQLMDARDPLAGIGDIPMH